MIDDKTRRPRRLSKTFLARTKWVAGGLSVVAFAGSLFGIITLNPGVKIAAATASSAAVPTAPAPPPGFVAPASNSAATNVSGGNAMPVEPQMPTGLLTPVQPQAQLPQFVPVRPFARTRGS